MVDLSETWHNNVMDARDEKLLGEIGKGISAFAETASPPVSVQYRVIGVESLDRQPLCDAVFETKLLATKDSGSDYEVSKLRKLKGYLGKDCPALIVQQPPEKLTQISAAIDSVTAKPKPLHSTRYMIILSDFLEEAGGPPAPVVDLTGTRVLMVYRPVQQDGGNPAVLKARMDAWIAKLTAAGAEVQAIPDAGVKQSDVIDFLKGTQG